MEAADTIELNEADTVEFDEAPKSRALPRLALYLAIFLATVVGMAVAAFYVNQARLWAVDEAQRQWNAFIGSLTTTQIVREYVTVNEASMPELISSAAREYKLEPVVLQALIFKESAGGQDNWLYKFEPEKFASRANVDRSYREDERRMRASSHGVAQVMGYNAEPLCGVHWSKLYDNGIAVRCAAKIIRGNLDSQRKDMDAAARLRTAFRMYNGSGPDAEAYADHVMSRVGQLLYKQTIGAN